MSSLPTQQSIAMRTSVWVLGMLLALPGQTLETCTCLEALETICITCVMGTTSSSAQSFHQVIAQHHGGNCPCQCHHHTPQQTSITACENRAADDVDLAVRLTACSKPTRWDTTAQSLFSDHARMRPAVPALLRCATLSRFLL